MRRGVQLSILPEGATVRLGMEVLRRPDYEITAQHLLAAAIALAEQLLKDGYALADL